MNTRTRAAVLVVLAGAVTIVQTPCAKPPVLEERIDAWAHVLGRIVRGGAPNAEGPYAASYARAHRSRHGVESTLLLVDAPDRELALAKALLASLFVREAAFHLRNVCAFHPASPEADRAEKLLKECSTLSVLEHLAPLSLVLSDGRRFLTTVPAATSGLTLEDRKAIGEGRFEETARRHPRTPAAFALLYDAARQAKGDDAARLYRDALALVHLPALPLAQPGDTPHRAVGFIDDAMSVAVTPLNEPSAMVFPDSDFETGGALVANRVYYQVEPGPLREVERQYKLAFLVHAAAALGETPELERARVYWGGATAEVCSRHAAPDGPLDLAYNRAVAAVPYLRVDAPSVLTKGPDLPVKLDWANVDRVRFCFSPVADLPRTEPELRKKLESLREADLAAAYEHVAAPAANLSLPLREPGTWRVTAEGGGVACTFFAVRADPKLEALIFPAETVLLTNRPGVTVTAFGAPPFEEKNGAVRIGSLQGAKYCSAHEECCKGCESCAHHHDREPAAIRGAVELFACDGLAFFRARATPDPALLPQVKKEPFGPALYVYADRPVYRAGDTLKFRGLVRIPKESFGRDGRFDVLPKADVEVSILRDKETLFRRNYVTGDFGTFAGEFTLPLTTARAEYQLAIHYGPSKASASFEVVDYRKSDYVITLESRKGAVAVRAGYAWGAPVAGTTVKAFVKDVERPIRDGLVAAAGGDPVRVVLVRGDEELASKTHVHREPAAALEPEPAAAGGAASASGAAGSSAPRDEPGEGVRPIRTAKRVYGRGETIEVELAGADGEALVVLGDAVAYDWQRVPVRNGHGVARFQVTATHDPGTTIFAVLGGKVEHLPVEINAQRMRVDLVPDATTAKPGEEVGVTVRGLPGAELSLAAVDEAVFMIKEDASPDLYGAFYPARAAAMAHVAFEIAGDSESRIAERPPEHPFLKPAARRRDRVFRDLVEANAFETNIMGVGGGAGGGGSYGGRFGGRENLVARGGGTRATESAVLANLKGLAALQRTDGSWGPGDTKTDFGTINAVGRTSLVLLSFLGAGYSHLSSDEYDGLKFGEIVKGGLRSLLRMQAPDGCVGPETDDYLANHALAAMALSEAYGMSAALLYKAPAQNALGFLALRQAADGGWHPGGGSQGHAGATALAVMALKSGQLSELDYGTVAAMNASRFFRTLTQPDGSCPVSRAPGAPVTPFSTACAMLSFQFLDANRNEPRLVGMHHLVRVLPEIDRPDYATWYMSSLALFQYDGPDGPLWKKWNEPMKNAVVPLQRRNGMWAAEAPLPDSICMTGFAGLTLMTYYRYSNVFGAKGGRSAETEPLPLAPKPAIRIHFPDTALWIPDLVTDANGEARARLRMPDSITTIRLTSRGITKDSAVGEGVARIESKQPFFVNLKTPAFFVAGDEAEIRAEVFNYTGGAVETVAELSGDGFAVIGDAARRLKVGAACESVSWRVRIAEVERARFRVATDRDSVERALPVRPRVAPASRSFREPVFVVSPGEKPLDLVLRVGPRGSALSKVLDALRFLNEYPHG